MSNYLERRVFNAVEYYSLSQSPTMTRRNLQQKFNVNKVQDQKIPHNLCEKFERISSSANDIAENVTLSRSVLTPQNEQVIEGSYKLNSGKYFRQATTELGLPSTIACRVMRNGLKVFPTKYIVGK